MTTIWRAMRCSCGAGSPAGRRRLSTIWTGGPLTGRAQVLVGELMYESVRAVIISCRGSWRTIGPGRGDSLLLVLLRLLVLDVGHEIARRPTGVRVLCLLLTSPHLWLTVGVIVWENGLGECGGSSRKSTSAIGAHVAFSIAKVQMKPVGGIARIGGRIGTVHDQTT